MNGGALLPALLSTGEAVLKSGVPAWQTWLFAGILVATLALLATEKIHKAVLVLVSAGLCLFLADGFGYFEHGGGGHMPVYISMIEWEVIGIVIGATVFVEIAARSGLFTWISVKMLKASRGDPFRLLLFFSVMTVVFSAFLDNITAMIIVGSLTMVACLKLKLDPVPYLLVEGFMTNVGGLLTLISSIPNIIVGKAADISYLRFLQVTGPYVILAIILSVAIARWRFGGRIAPLADEEARERNARQVDSFDEWDTVKDRRFFYVSAFGVLAVILLFALKNQIPVLQDFGVEVVAMAAAVIMLLLHGKDVEKDLEKVEWSMVFFFVGLFIIIGVIDLGGVLTRIGEAITAVTNVTGSIGLMWLTALFSSVTDNIPLAAMLAKVLGPTHEAAMALPRAQWWAVVFGANLGGNITPIGSASTVVAVTIMKRNGLKISFIDFVKIGAIFAAAQLALASVYLLVLEGIL